MTRAAAVAIALAMTGCGGGLAVPTTGAHVGEEPVLVPFPPPPARVEIIPAPPAGSKRAVWVDGEWLWKGRRWVWQQGQWFDAPPGATYAPPATVRLSDGQTAWFAGAWHGVAPPVGAPPQTPSPAPSPAPAPAP
jgi:hypothetical protein